MALEEVYNMLNKRTHLQDPLSASLDFLGAVEFSPGESGLKHRYSSWCYNYLEGSRGVYRFGDGEITIEPGCGFLIPPYTAHYLLNPGPEAISLVYMGISFNNSVTLGFGAGPATIEETKRINDMIRDSYYTKVFSEKFHILFRQLKAVGFAGSEEILMGYRIMVLENLLKLFEFTSSQVQSKPSDADAVLLQDIKNIIIHNFSRNISLPEISRALYISPRKLTSKFLELTGMSFKEYTQMLKMEYASRLLYSSSMSISEIAEELGFCDIHYFSRRFKMYYGCPPNALRSKSRQKGDAYDGLE